MFKFKLETLLSLKEKIEEGKKRELGLQILQVEKIENEKKQLEDKRKRIRETTCNTGCFLVKGNLLKTANQFQYYLNEQISDKEKQFIVAQNQVILKREELLEAVNQRRMLENLKEIHKERFEEEEKKKEQQIVDELITYKYGKKEG